MYIVLGEERLLSLVLVCEAVKGALAHPLQQLPAQPQWQGNPQPRRLGWAHL